MMALILCQRCCSSNLRSLDKIDFRKLIYDRLPLTHSHSPWRPRIQLITTTTRRGDEMAKHKARSSQPHFADSFGTFFPLDFICQVRRRSAEDLLHTLTPQLGNGSLFAEHWTIKSPLIHRCTVQPTLVNCSRITAHITRGCENNYKKNETARSRSTFYTNPKIVSWNLT